MQRAVNMVSIALARPSAQGWPDMISCSLHNSLNECWGPVRSRLQIRWNQMNSDIVSQGHRNRPIQSYKNYGLPTLAGHTVLAILHPGYAAQMSSELSEDRIFSFFLEYTIYIGIFQVDFFLIWVPPEHIQISRQVTEMDSMSRLSGIFSLSKLCFPAWSVSIRTFTPVPQMVREEINPSHWSQRLIYPLSGSIRTFTEISSASSERTVLPTSLWIRWGYISSQILN